MANARLRAVGSAAHAPRTADEELVRKLRAGEIDRKGFYDAAVELGLAHLKARMTAAQLEIARERMREEVESNPILIKMLEDALRETS